MSLNITADLTECHTHWGEEFFNNNDSLPHHQEETLLSLELDVDTLDALPQEATILSDSIFDDWDFSDINLDLEELTAESLLVEPLLDLPGSHPSQGTKRRVGRPAKTEVGAVTPLPTGPVTKRALQKARYRRMRDLNNIASQKCRLKK